MTERSNLYRSANAIRDSVHLKTLHEFIKAGKPEQFSHNMLRTSDVLALLQEGVRHNTLSRCRLEDICNIVRDATSLPPIHEVDVNTTSEIDDQNHKLITNWSELPGTLDLVPALRFGLPSEEIVGKTLYELKRLLDPFWHQWAAPAVAHLTGKTTEEIVRAYPNGPELYRHSLSLFERCNQDDFHEACATLTPGTEVIVSYNGKIRRGPILSQNAKDGTFSIKVPDETTRSGLRTIRLSQSGIVKIVGKAADQPIQVVPSSGESADE